MGPYLSERQWGTVREDYSQDGNAWDDFSHDQARSRAYHWGEDGLANKRRTRMDPEYELLDTGIFNEDRYFDVFVEYAKAVPTDLLIEISVCNRGPAESVIHVLALWFRNLWTWWPEEPKPSLTDASNSEFGQSDPTSTATNL
jgi:hypothetical protein